MQSLEEQINSERLMENTALNLSIKCFPICVSPPKSGSTPLLNQHLTESQKQCLNECVQASLNLSKTMLETSVDFKKF